MTLATPIAIAAGMISANDQGAVSIELSVVIPTFKERANVAILIERLDQALAGVRWEAIFVDDDSPDGTAAAVKTLSTTDSRVRCIRRVNRRGLAGACIEGMLSSSASYVAVMDADLQHDETILPRMLDLLRRGSADLVVGSRYMEGGNAASFSKRRGTASKMATQLARYLTGITISDPMSGFFMMRRDSFDRLAESLSTQGFKILLDIVITAKGSLQIAEVPFVFAARQHGESKLDVHVSLDFLGLLASKITGGVVTPRFLTFAFVGGVGLLVHLAALRTSLTLFALPFAQSQAAATFVAMTGNFIFNNSITFRDKRLNGFAFFRGLLGFYAISSIGAVTNVGIATWLYAYDPVWWLAGVSGALMGAVWNYSMSTLLVWRVK